MDVMKGEVARLLQLADHSIVPVTWQVITAVSVSMLTIEFRFLGSPMTSSTPTFSPTPMAQWRAWGPGPGVWRQKPGAWGLRIGAWGLGVGSFDFAFSNNLQKVLLLSVQIIRFLPTIVSIEITLARSSS